MTSLRKRLTPTALLMLLAIAPIALLSSTVRAELHGGGAEKQADEPTQTIAEIASADERFSTLVAAVEAANLVDALNDESADLTVFAPTNDAFAALPEGTVESLLQPENRETLTSVLLHHTVQGSVSAERVVAIPALRSLNGTGLTIDTSGDGVVIDGATVIITDIAATNGVIHVIDAVMLPEDDDQLPTIAGLGTGAENLSTLVQALQAAEWVEMVDQADAAPVTVFAPTNEAFAAVPEDVLATLLNDQALLRKVLSYHVVQGDVYAADAIAAAEEGAEVPTLQGETVALSMEDGAVFVNDAQVVATDLFASNGIVHVIDAVLVPQEVLDALGGGDDAAEDSGDEKSSILETAKAAGSFSTLLYAVNQAGLTETLNGDGPFTVFAPTDAAFAAVPRETLAALLEDREALANVLTYHVVAGKVNAGDLSDGQTVTMVNGGEAEIAIDGDTVTIAGVQITMTDIECSNGVIHVIDAVMMP